MITQCNTVKQKKNGIKSNEITQGNKEEAQGNTELKRKTP